MRYGPRFYRGGLGQNQNQNIQPQQLAPQGPDVLGEDLYTYSVEFEALGANSSGTGFIQIEADSDFWVQKMTYFAHIDGDPQTFNSIVVPLVTVVIIDTGSGRQIMNRPIPVSDLFGDGRLPFIVPTPKLFVKNSRINFEVFNFANATDYTQLWLNLTGKKIFTQG